MALPPKGDPRRPLHLAVRSMRLLGGILLLFTSCMALSVGMTLIRLGPKMLTSPLMFIGMLLYFVPGVCFFVFAHYLKRRQAWAVVASICLAGVGCLFMLIGLFGLAVISTSQSRGGAPMLIPAGIMLLILAALGQLIYHLARSFEAIKYMPPEERGFEPIMTGEQHDSRHLP